MLLVKENYRSLKDNKRDHPDVRLDPDSRTSYQYRSPIFPLPFFHIPDRIEQY